MTQFYLPQAEASFLQTATSLTLKLALREAGSTPIFKPLSQCDRSALALDLSWRQRNQHLTPMFGLTQASQASAFEDAADGLRMTQGTLNFTQTQTFVQDLAGSARSQTQTQYSNTQQVLLVQRRRRQDSAFGSAAHMGTQEQHQLGSAHAKREIQRLRRRFVRSKPTTGNTAMFHARRANQRKAMQRKLVDDRRKARFAQVQLYRAYRDGEVLLLILLVLLFSLFSSPFVTL